MRDVLEQRLCLVLFKHPAIGEIDHVAERVMLCRQQFFSRDAALTSHLQLFVVKHERMDLRRHARKNVVLVADLDKKLFVLARAVTG